MKWVALLTLLAIASGCTEGDNSHREYIITQASIADDTIVNSSIELPD